MARINKSPKETFKIVSKNIAKWTDEIQSVEWEHNNAEIVGRFGIGSVRKCQVDDDLVVEDIVYWKERSLPIA